MKIPCTLWGQTFDVDCLVDFTTVELYDNNMQVKISTLYNGSWDSFFSPAVTIRRDRDKLLHEAIDAIALAKNKYELEKLYGRV